MNSLIKVSMRQFIDNRIQFYRCMLDWLLLGGLERGQEEGGERTFFFRYRYFMILIHNTGSLLG